MARPREFDEGAVLRAAMESFWAHGYDATSVRDLIEATGLTGASLYNAFGDKRALYQKALDHYVETGVAERIRRHKKLPARQAIEAFFAEIVKRSLADRQHKGCMLVNAALEIAPHDPGFQKIVSGVLTRIETFFFGCVSAGQVDGTITKSIPTADLARHLLATLLGLRVLARVRPERALLESVISSAFALLNGSDSPPAARR
jgi:TetR/AcrR family transcriptional regulator, transcriptional repressor for nem operon